MNRASRTITIIEASLVDPLFIAEHRSSPSAFTRKRKLTFAIVVSTILQLAKKSMQIECNLIGERLMAEPASKQAFSKARYNISYTGFQALNKKLLNECYRDNNEGLWHGYRVLGIDGSTIRLPKSNETEEYFGRWDRGQDRNEKCPIVARISEVVELTTGIIVNAKIAPWRFGERVMASEQIEEVAILFHNFEQHKQLFVFDRGYISKNLMELIRRNDADFMFRMPSGYNNKIDELVAKGASDTVFELSSDFPKLRLVVHKLPSGEDCVLLTSIIDQEKIPSMALHRLYWRRWTSCEEGYKKQKVTLELENFIGTGVEAVLQEFWATIVAINIFQLHCFVEEGAWDVEAPPVERINRSVAFGSLRGALFDVLLSKISAQQFKDKFLQVARRSKVKVRPGRSYSRSGVDKPKRYHVFRRTC